MSARSADRRARTRGAAGGRPSGRVARPAPAFEVLAEPHRRRILELLLERERSVGELVGQLALAQPTVSKHLKLLYDTGFVEVRREAQRRVYRLRSEPLLAIDAWLDPYRRLWNGRFDALGQHLDAMPDE